MYSTRCAGSAAGAAADTAAAAAAAQLAGTASGGGRLPAQPPDDTGRRDPCAAAGFGCCPAGVSCPAAGTVGRGGAPKRRKRCCRCIFVQGFALRALRPLESLAPCFCCAGRLPCVRTAAGVAPAGRRGAWRCCWQRNCSSRWTAAPTAAVLHWRYPLKVNKWAEGNEIMKAVILESYVMEAGGLGLVGGKGTGAGHHPLCAHRLRRHRAPSRMQNWCSSASAALTRPFC